MKKKNKVLYSLILFLSILIVGISLPNIKLDNKIPIAHADGNSSKTTTKKATKAVIKKNKSVQSKTKTAVKRSQPAKVYSVKRSLLPDMAVSPLKAQNKSVSPLMAAFALPDATVTPSSGTYGTSKWSINSSGVLTIGAGTFPNNDENSPWQSNSDITKIVITGKVILGNDASELFYRDDNVQSIEGISNLDTSNVTDMNSMFSDDSEITSLDLSNFNTSKVTDMPMMFSGDSSLTNLNVSSFDTSNVTSMSSMFVNDSEITSLDLSNFNTSKVTDMSAMLEGDSSLTNLNVSSFDTSNVTDMNSMFNGDSEITSLDLSNFNTSKVTDMSAMLSGDSSLTNLNVSSFDTSNVTGMRYMFLGDSEITSLDLSNFNTSKVKSMSYMFAEDSSLTNLNVSSFDTSNVTSMSSMFDSDSKLTSLDLSKWNTSNVKNMSGLFDSTSSLNELTLGPKFRLYNSSWQSTNLSNPAGGTNWQAVDSANGGTVDFPRGTVYSTADLVSLYTNSGLSKVETYVAQRAGISANDLDFGSFTISASPVSSTVQNVYTIGTGSNSAATISASVSNLSANGNNLAGTLQLGNSTLTLGGSSVNLETQTNNVQTYTDNAKLTINNPSYTGNYSGSLTYTITNASLS